MWVLSAVFGELSLQGCGEYTVGSQPLIDNLRVVAGERVACLPSSGNKQGENSPATPSVDGRSMLSRKRELWNKKKMHYYHLLFLPLPVVISRLFSVSGLSDS